MSSANTGTYNEFPNTLCERHQVLPGLYYCSWDSHHRFGSLTPGMVGYDNAFTTRVYQDFQLAQLEELLTQYGKIGEVWIDIPRVLPRDFRQTLYHRIAALQPDAVILMNNGLPDPTAPRLRRLEREASLAM